MTFDTDIICLILQQHDGSAVHYRVVFWWPSKLLSTVRAILNHLASFYRTSVQSLDAASYLTLEKKTV